MPEAAAHPDHRPDHPPSPPPPAEVIDLSVVIPCLNERETIASVVKAACEGLRLTGLAGEVVVADNGSSDGSQDAARAAGARVVPVKMRGYGAALLGGTEAARGRWVIMGDADGQHDFLELPRFVERLKAGDELVMGSRSLGSVEKGAMGWKNRYLGNPVLSRLGRRLFKAPVSDFNCGYRGFDRARFLGLHLRTTGMEFASEHVIKSALGGLRIGEVPITVHPSGRSRPAHLRPWRDGWRHLRFMLLMSPRGTLIKPGALLVALGTLLGAWVLAAPLLPSGLRLDAHALLAACFLVLVGYQGATVGIAAHVFASEQGLIPPSRTLRRTLERFTLERGVTIGLIIAAAGGLMLGLLGLYALLGRLPTATDPTFTLRALLIGGTLVALGGQTVLMSFFYSMLGMQYHGRPPGLASILQQHTP